MNQQSLRQLLAGVKSGAVSEEEALETLKDLPFEDLGYAKVDHHRALRCGLVEVIYGEGKTPEQVVGISKSLRQKGGLVLVTRTNDEQTAALAEVFQDALVHPDASAVTVGPLPVGTGLVGIVSAGTSDHAVAAEAALTARCCGAIVKTWEDVGVAGVHRLLSYREELEAVRALVVVAGMEGALPSVVAGLVSKPVIAVPTSVGYGVALGGLAALMGMLSSCASGVSVVNIDNGFGAGYQAALINGL